MATKLNKEGFEYAKNLIEKGKFKADEGHWRAHQPSASEENIFINRHTFREYSQWHLGIDTELEKDEKGRYKFPYGDFESVHRDGLMAVKQRAAQNGYSDIEEAAGKLLAMMEKTRVRQ